MTGPVPLRLTGERRHRLLAYLGLRGTWVSRDALATLFWPDRGQKLARSNLRKLLMELRALAVTGLESDRSGLRWSVACDADEMLSARSRNEHAQVLDLYRGELLPGLDGGDSEAFDSWLSSHRDHLRQCWRASVLSLVAQSPPAAALDLAQRLLDADPLDEDAMVAALTSQRSLGLATEATRRYREYSTRLLDQLGIEPSVQLRTLAEPKFAASPEAQDVAGPDHVDDSDEFIDREQELGELFGLLRGGSCRALTLTGPGGVGKSALALQAIRKWPDGDDRASHWIALEDLDAAGQVAARIARELGLAPNPQGDPFEQIAGHLASKRAVLVLDNAEHLRGLSTLIERLLAAAPALQCLITSRTRLGFEGEWLLPLGELALPEPAATSGEILRCSSARLFVQQALAAQPRFDAVAQAEPIASLVRAVGGLPLAIRLAASWVRLLPVTELCADVATSLDVLEQDASVDERAVHSSIRATFEQSWRLLAPREQRALSALSLCLGSFSRDAARRIADAPLPVLAALVDKSLLQVASDGRFSLHPLMRQFAGEKLAAEGARHDQVRDLHADVFGETLAALGHFDSIDQAAALKVITAELPNVLAAWDWAIRRARFGVLYACAQGLSNLYQTRGPITEGAALFARAEAAIESASTQPLEVLWTVALERAALNYRLGSYAEVETAGRKALAAARQLRRGFAIRTSLNTLGLALLRQGRLAQSVRYLDEALKRAQADREPVEVASYAGNLAGIWRELGDDERATRLAKEALAGHRANGHQVGEVSLCNELGLLAHHAGRNEEALEWYRQGLAAAERYGLPLTGLNMMSHRAAALLDQGKVELARQDGEEALRLVLQHGARGHEPACRSVMAQIDIAQGRRDAAREQLRAALAVIRPTGVAASTLGVLHSCALFALTGGDPAAALQLSMGTEVLRNSKATPFPAHAAVGARARAALDGAAQRAAESQASTMTLETALAEAGRVLTRC